MILSAVPCAAAGTFTRNVVKADPVILTREHLADHKAQGILFDSGNANACAPKGMENAQRMAQAAAAATGLQPQDFAVCSTGIIGVELNIQAIEQGDKAGSLQEIQAALRTLVEYFPQAGQPSDNEKKLVEQIRGYVEDNLDQSLTVNDVATALFMNGDYLSRLFKSETGTSLKEYILQRKMEAARLLLTTTQLPVSVIASRLGYDNFSYFSQVYRRCMGIYPLGRAEKEISPRAAPGRPFSL